MTLYAIFKPQPGAAALPEAIADRFSWFAFLLPPVHALVHGLWDQLALFLLGLVAITFVETWIGPDALFWLYLVLALACGFAASGARQRALRRRGYLPSGYRFAPDADAARLTVMETTP